MSGVGFEPTPSIEDQKSLLVPDQGTRLVGLESGALDHSANLTLYLCLVEKADRVCENKNLSRARLELATFCV